MMIAKVGNETTVVEGYVGQITWVPFFVQLPRHKFIKLK